MLNNDRNHEKHQQVSSIHHQ